MSKTLIAVLLWQSAARADVRSSALELMRQQKFAAAATLLDNALEANPASEDILYRLDSDAHARMGDLSSALRLAEQGLHAHPASPFLDLCLGELLFQKDPKDDRAGELLALAAKTSPESAEAHHYYGQWAYLNHKQGLASEEENRALALVGANDLAKLQMNLIVGLAEDQMGHSDRADAAFRRAMIANRRLPAPDPAAAYQYVEFLERNGRLEEADVLSRDVLKRSPHFGPARVVYAKALARHGDLRGAALEAEQALTEIGDDPEPVRTVHYFLAKTWLQLKEPSKAQPHQDWLARHAE